MFSLSGLRGALTPFSGPIHSCADARILAQQRLPWMVFDYIDGAAGSGYGEQLNRDTLQGIRLQPRVLNNVEHRDLSVDILGQVSNLPFGISPMGMCNLSAPGADLMLARLAAKHKIPVGVSTVASVTPPSSYFGIYLPIYELSRH